MPAAEVPGLAQRGLQGCGLRGRGAHRPGSFPASPVPGGGGDQADAVPVVQEHGQGASAVPADVELAEFRVVAGDGSLVAGPEPGVRVVGVLKGDAVAALEPAADAADLADPGEPDVQLGFGRPGAQALTGPGVGDHGSGGLDHQVRAGEDDDAGDPRAGVGDLGLQLVVVPGGDVGGLAGQGLRVGHREAVQLVFGHGSLLLLPSFPDEGRGVRAFARPGFMPRCAGCWLAGAGRRGRGRCVRPRPRRLRRRR